MSEYRLPKNTKQIPRHTKALEAAAEFVWAVDNRKAITPNSASELRNALANILEGADAHEFFPKLQRGQRPTKSDRDLIVATYVEMRRRQHENEGVTAPLAKAKTDASDAFDWPLEDPESAVQDAWQSNQNEVRQFSNQVIEGLLAPWRSQN